jgi:hypothetical protein
MRSCMGEITNSYKFLVEISEDKGPLNESSEKMGG